MAYVKLDCGMLDSTLWIDRCARELFITALLMAEPTELTEPAPQIKVDSLEHTGFQAPVGWYGFVPAAGSGIVRRCGMDQESGMEALRRLGEPERESRTPDFEGRRMIRVNGGYLILNYDAYRNKDHTSAERSRRYRERKKSRVTTSKSRVTSRSITQAEAEADSIVSANADTPAPSAPALVPTAADIFEAYPRKVARADAIKAIEKALKKHGPAYLLERTVAYAKTQAPNDRFTPHPSTWFNQERFDDDPETWKPKNARDQGHPTESTRNLGTQNAGRGSEYANAARKLSDPGP